MDTQERYKGSDRSGLCFYQLSDLDWREVGDQEDRTGGFTQDRKHGRNPKSTALNFERQTLLLN